MSSSKENSLDNPFPIRTLSMETGVNTVTLRAWERRYGLLKPTRTPKGHRLYCQSDIDTVRSIVQWIQKGVPVGKVKALLANSEPEKAVGEEFERVEEDVWYLYRTQFLESATAYQESKLLAAFQEVTTQYPVEIVVSQLIEPIMNDLARLDDNKTASRFFTSCLTKQVAVNLNFYRHQGKRNSKILVLNSALDSAFWSGLMALLLQARGFDPIWLSDVHNPVQWQSLLTELKPDKCLCVCENVLPENIDKYMVHFGESDVPIVITGSEIWLTYKDTFKEFGDKIRVYPTSMDGVKTLRSSSGSGAE
ncbi:MerR family transcriptional regulator [Marinomonas balearica]|uniref:MerR-like DNA binding protein n=1 Tax=Marinomonas balearica TaxID=491947 RepID=A0A4R6MAD9_9GAMM|nr:MerR family transcriptional regulator [Marinomonas balearica]TDO98226.1 MerR-like DNA binding protein [Marinomonas balearica]